MFKNRWKEALVLRNALLAVAAASLIPSGFAQQSKASVARTHVVTMAPRGAAVRAASEDQVSVAPLPAHVILAHGLLTVEASNSDLGQILEEISRVTGMSVSGLNGGPRVFGVYGPADPRSVLTSLLMGSGYNFLLVGGAAMPRALVLAPETAAPPTTARAPKPAPQDEYEEQYAEQDSTDPYMR